MSVFTIDLLDPLLRLSRIWAETSGLPLSTLGNRAVLHSGLFERIAEGSSITVQRYEKLARWLAAGENWPDNRIPLAAVDLLDRLENIAVGDGEATGLASDVSPEMGEAA